MNASRAPPAAPARSLAALALAVIGLTGAAAAGLLVMLRADAIDAGSRLGASFADIIQEQTSRSLQAADLRLELTATHFSARAAAGPVGTEAGHEFLSAQLRHQPFLRAMWITDAQGRIAYDTMPGTIGGDLSTRPYFLAARERPDGGLTIGEPRDGQFHGQRLITVSRPLQGAGSSFAGVIAAALDPPYFDRLWRSIELGPGVTISLFRRDGTLLMRSPFDAGMAGRVPKDIRIIDEPVAERAAGTFRKLSAFEGDERLFAYHRLSYAPDLVVVVGQRLDTVTADWRRMAWTLSGVWLAGALLLGALTRQFLRGAAERERAAGELLASRRELQATLDAVPDLLFEMNHEGRYLGWHATRHDLLAAPPEGLRGRLMAEVLPPAAAASAGAALAEARETGYSLGRQIELPLAQGPRWFELSVSRKTAAGDPEPRFVMLSRDITRRKQAEAELQHINRTLRVLGAGNQALLSSRSEADLQDAVCRSVVAAGSYVMGWIGLPENDAARTVRPVAIAGDTGEAYLSGIRVSWDESAPQGRGPTGRAIRSGQVQACNDYDSNPDMAPWRSLAMSFGYRSSIALPLPGRERVLGALMLYAREPHAFEGDAVAPLTELARNVAMAIETLRAQNQRDAANDANRAKSRFLASMSHEIRTPINAISGLTHLLRQDTPTPQQADRLAKIAAANRHLLSIINDVLDLSKIEAGGLQLHEGEFETAALFEHVRTMIAGDAAAKSLELVVELNGTPPVLAGDEMRLKQALLNYAGNALKFTEYGSIRLAAEVLEAEGERLLVRFSVHDTGIGVASADIDRIFGAFEQASAGTASRYGGTGLGLAIVERLARLMGGEAGASSRVGEGSSFWFTARLRRVDRHGEPARPEAPAADPLQLLRERHAGARCCWPRTTR